MKSLAMAMAAVWLVAVGSALADDEKFVWVEPEKANVRAEPRSGAKVVDKVSFGKRLLALDKIEDWYRVDLGGGKSGYIHEDVVTDDAPGHVWVDVDHATVHRSAREGAKTVATLDRGAMLECDGSRDEWHHVRVDDKRSGWISEKYIDDDPPDTLFVVTDTAAVHKTPSPDAEVVGEVHLGDQLDELGDAGPFKQVRTASGAMGFVFEDAVADERPEWLFVKVSDAPVLADPDMASEVLAKLPSGKELRAFDEEHDFHLVMLEDGTPGWLHDDYVISMGKR